MMATPFTDLVNDAARELADARCFRAAELLKLLTSKETEAEQESAARREAYETSLSNQLFTINVARRERGEEPLTMSLWLAGGD